MGASVKLKWFFQAAKQGNRGQPDQSCQLFVDSGHGPEQVAVGLEGVVGNDDGDRSRGDGRNETKGR